MIGKLIMSVICGRSMHIADSLTMARNTHSDADTAPRHTIRLDLITV